MAEMKRVIFTQITEKENQQMQVPFKTDMIVPDTKPDLGRILKTKARIEIHEKSLDHGRMHWNGQMICQILYAGEEDARDLHAMECRIDMDEYMNLELPDGDGRIRYVLDCQVTEVKAIILNSRKVNLQAILRIRVDVFRYNEHSVISQIEGISQLQVRKSEQQVTVLCLDREEKYMVKDEIAIESSSANIQEILWWEAAIVRTEHRIMNGRAVLQGELLVNVLYHGGNAEESAEYVEKCIPFQGIFDAASLHEDVPLKVVMNPSQIAVRPAADEDGEPRVVLVEAMIDCQIQVYEQQSLTIIEDVYAPGWKLDPQWTLCEMKNCHKQENRLLRIQETLQIPETYPKALHLYGVSAKPQVDDYYALDNVINLDGVLKVQLFYISADERYPIAAIQEMIPFTELIHEIPETMESVDVHPVLMKIEADMINEQEIKIQAEIRLDLCVMEEQLLPLMTNIEMETKDPEEFEKMPSMSIYIVQQGEDLWKIAKTHETTMERIATINHLEEPGELPVGRPLLLLKSM